MDFYAVIHSYIHTLVFLVNNFLTKPYKNNEKVRSIQEIINKILLILLREVSTVLQDGIGSILEVHAIAKPLLLP